MKKIVSIAAVVALLFSLNVNATPDPKAKKKAVKTEKACTDAEKKACASSEKKACCAAKKAEEKK